MFLQKNASKNRITERVFLLLTTIILGLLFMKLFNVLQMNFAEVSLRIKEGTIINVNDPEPGKNIKKLLEKGHYFSDSKDIKLASIIFDKGRFTSVEVIDNIGEINKSKYELNAEQAFLEGGESYKRRAMIERALVGFSDIDSSLFFSERKNPIKVPNPNNVAMGQREISGTVVNGVGSKVPGVLIRLTMILPPDSLLSEAEEGSIISVFNKGIRKSFMIDSVRHRQLQSLVAFARTDNLGYFSFAGLPSDKAFAILPLQPGFEFGRSQGVPSLDKNYSFTFKQLPNTIKLFSTKDFSALKKEKSLIVRTPEEAGKWFWIIAFSFLISFWILHVYFSFRFPTIDSFILPVLMLLTGLSIITLLSLQDPLRDRFLSKSTLNFFAAGIIGIVMMMQFQVRYFTVDSPLYRLFALQNIKKAANGWQWAFLAIGLLILTIIFGSGPEGSGVKVNLFGFQPSEIIKFLIIIFLAGFFAANEKFISEYSNWHKRFYFFFFALAAIGITILLFLLLGDLGPAMVVCFTFIFLFSFSRGDFSSMISSVVLYIIAVWLLKNVWIATAVTIGVLLLYMAIRKKQLSESSVMAVMLIAGFLLIDQVPVLSKAFPGPVQRLTDRKAIWQDAWNNEVYGGDQVANGIWAMAGGGLTGQGVGQGFAKTIPEAHTDMILPSIGEEFGGAVVMGIFILFFLYLHRSINIGRQTGTPFLFYLCSGIGISTFMQFLLISGGSTGALPLSGVALPFISYGGSSLLVNMLAAGFLLAASSIRGTTSQMKFITRQQDKNLLPALVAACIGILLLGANVSKYIFNNSKWVVEPALVSDKSGARMFSYNPRINILMSRLQAGDLIDRKGRIVATSHPDQLRLQADSLVTLGISAEMINALSYKRLDRYYPFGEQMFFWTGDANTGVFNGSPNGYFAEYEHAAELRGFPTPTNKFQVSASRYKQDRFLPQTSTEMTVNKRDYSALAPLLLAGINSTTIEQFKQKNRDVQLTIDAALQTSINKALATDDSVKLKRVSVVIMEDNTGDVLASSSYPLPQVNNWDMLTLSEAEQNRLSGWNVNRDMGFTYATQPGSTAKLVTALSAFNKFGEAAATMTKRVLPQDLIRVKGPEPDEAGNITIERAIVKSNNSFFIRLANEDRLEEEMGTLYLKTGMFLHGVGGYYYDYEGDDVLQQNKWRDLWRSTEFQSYKFYNPNNIKRTRGKGISGMSWGQGELIATPASVARVAAGIANKGTLMENRYVLSVSGKPAPLKNGIRLTPLNSTALHMQDYMIEQSAGKVHRLHLAVAGKTGTPERIWKGARINDGWYVFFAPKSNGVGHIVTCIRMEAAKGSSEAVRLAGSYIIPILLKRGYIKGFEVKGALNVPGIDALNNELKKETAIDENGNIQNEGEFIDTIR